MDKKKKGFFSRAMEKLDSKLEKKAKAKKCCCCTDSKQC